MKEELYKDNLLLNEKVITSSKLDKNIKICNKVNGNDFVIDKSNLKNLKKVSNANIIIDCDLINIFKLSKELKPSKIKFKNIYLIEGNKLVKNTFNNIRKSLNVPINSYKVINYDPRINYFLNQLLYMIIAYQIKDVKKQYSYIYDIVCDELDRRFELFNICDFNNNLCCCKRCIKNKFSINKLIYGCCYTKGQVCPNLENNHCNIKCIGCKLFTCRYLKKKGIKYNAKDFLLIKYFFNYNQISIINDTLFTDKEDIINLLIKNKKVI